MATITTLDIDTPRGLARAHVHPARGKAVAALVMSHGAGGGVDAPDIVAATGVATALGVLVVLVEQPYRVAGRRSPAPQGHLDEAWISIIDALRAGPVRTLPVIVGGRSMGARVACRTAAAVGAIGVLCLAFPFQPAARAGKPAAPNRQPELDAVKVPVLVVQGDRDPFGMPPNKRGRTIAVVAGDHGLKKDLPGVAAAVETWLQRITG